MGLSAAVEPSAGLLLALWLASGTPAAVATARLDRLPVAVMVWLSGPVAWCAWVFARRHDTEAKTEACSRRFLSQV